MSSESPKRFLLSTYHQFLASHALEGFEIPHFHLWKIAIEFEVPFPLSGDRVIDLVVAGKMLRGLTFPLEGTCLNDTLMREDSCKLSPTSENLCVWIWDRWSAGFSDIPISSVSVTLCDLEGRPAGKSELRK